MMTGVGELTQQRKSEIGALTRRFFRVGTLGCVRRQYGEKQSGRPMFTDEPRSADLRGVLTCTR